MKKILRFNSKILALSLIFAMIFSTTADALQWPSEISVDRPNPVAVGSPVKHGFTNGMRGKVIGKEFNFKTSVKGKTENIFLTFPTTGGMRINTQSIKNSKSNFEPKELFNIKAAVSDTDRSKQIITAGNMQIEFKLYPDKGWEIATKKANGDYLIIKSSDFNFGYEDSGYRNRVIFSGRISEGETVYGFGERFNSFNQVGNDLMLWNTDGYETGRTDKDRTLSYANVPILHSSTGYSIFFNTYYNVIADIGKTVSDKYTVTIDSGDIIDMFIWTGKPEENIRSYAQLTGKSVNVPKWAFGYWAGGPAARWGWPNISAEKDKAYKWRFDTALKNYVDLGTIPAALYGEGWPSGNKYAYEQLKKYGIRMINWNYPSGFDSKHPEQLKNYLPDVPQSEYPIVQKRDGSGFYENYIDYSSKHAVDLVDSRYKNLMSWGVRGSMVDFGEYIPWDTKFQNGKSGHSMHNEYAYHYNKVMKAVYDRNINNEDYILFSRAGAAGSQKFAASFTGDQTSTYEGMREQLNAILTASTSGFSVIGGDLGGFFGNPTRELYIRWLEFSTFQPLMRAHGGDYKKPREPWTYNANTEFKKYFYLRENLKDYIYSASQKSHKDGTPMVEPFAVAFPEQQQISAVNDQYMFCDKIMVAPVITENALSRKVVFPKGRWYSLFTGEITDGTGTAENINAALDEIPVYLKSGAVVPLKTADDLKLSAPFKSENAKDVILVTAPEKNENYICYGDSTENTYSLTLNSDGYSLKSQSTSGIKNILVYGEAVNGISVDGRKLNKTDANSSSEGYYREGRKNIIRLNSDWNKIDFNASSGTSFEFDTNEDINNFDAFFYGNTSGKNQIKYNNATDLFKNENGVLKIDTPISTLPDGQVNNVAALTFKDRLFNNFDLSFKVKQELDNSYGKYFYLSFREKTPGQVGKVGDYPNAYDAAGNYHPIILFENNGGVYYYGKHNEYLAAPQGINNQNKFVNYRIKALNSNITVWIDGKQVYSGNISETDTGEGYLSLVFSNMKAQIDSVSIVNLDSEGQKIFYPEASTRYYDFRNSLAASDTENSLLKDFSTSVWTDTEGYTVFNSINNESFGFTENGILSDGKLEWHGTNADNNIGLTLKNPDLRNFELELSAGFDNVSSYHGGLIINMREPKAGKAFHSMWTKEDKWPTVGKYADGSSSAAIYHGAKDKEVYLYNDGKSTKAGTVGIIEANLMHNYKIRVVGDRIYISLDGKAETVYSIENCANKGFISVIAANARVNIETLKIRWLDESGNPDSWGKVTAGNGKKYDFSAADSAAVFNDFTSSFWSKKGGYIRNASVDLNNWRIGEWGAAENSNSITTLDFNKSGWGDNMNALTFKNKYKNFELTANIQQNNPNGYTMISMREKLPGQPMHHIDAWEWGIQSDNTVNAVLYIDHHNSGNGNGTVLSYANRTIKDPIYKNINPQLKSNKIKVRIVGCQMTVWCNDMSGQGKTYLLDSETNAEGYISFVFDNTNGAVWDAEICELDGNGNPVDYAETVKHTVESIEDLQSMGFDINMPLSGNYALKNDISLKSGEMWNSIRDFSGKFDGCGHKISNLQDALFDSTAGNAEISNLVLEASKLSESPKYYGGAAVNTAKGESLTLSNIAVINASINKGAAGAFIGNAKYGKTVIKDCFFEGSLKADYTGLYVGGGKGSLEIQNSVVSADTFGKENIPIACDNPNPVTGNLVNMYGKNYGQGTRKNAAELGFDTDKWCYDGKLPQLCIMGKKSYKNGDSNLDGEINILDVVSLKKNVVNSDFHISYVAANVDKTDDVSGEAVLNSKDIIGLKKLLLNLI